MARQLGEYAENLWLDKPLEWRISQLTEMGFGIQCAYTEDGSLDETMAVSDGVVVLVPKGHHPCAAPYGFEMYYLNIMAGPLRKWRFLPDPAVERILEQDS